MLYFVPKMQKSVKEAQHLHGQKARKRSCSHIFLWNVSSAFHELIGPNLMHFPILKIFRWFKNVYFSISIILPIIGPMPRWSPNSTYLHLDFCLLSWRWWPLWSGGTFVPVACTATKSKAGPFSFQNIRVMYLKTVNLTTNWAKPPKNLFVSIFSAIRLDIPKTRDPSS